jgi:5'-nucleotidase
MDGVLADFETGFLEIWQTQYPERSFIPIHERKTFFIAEQYPLEFKAHVYSVFTSQFFYRKLKPIPGGREALLEMKKLGLEVVICTSPLTEYTYCVPEKYEWIEEHLGKAWVDKIVITKDKTLVKGDFLIDDKPEITGSDTPQWEHILYDQPYNRHLSLQRRLTWDNWKSIILPKT